LLDIDFYTNYESFIDDDVLKVKLGFAELVDNDKKTFLVVSYEMKQREKLYQELKFVR